VDGVAPPSWRLAGGRPTHRPPARCRRYDHKLQLTESVEASNFWLSCVGPMKRWQFVVLIFELALFAAILVLPQVALPDFTFHGGTAPVAAHSRICHPVPGPAIAAIPQTLFPDRTAQGRSEIATGFSPQPLQSRLSRLRVLIC